MGYVEVALRLRKVERVELLRRRRARRHQAGLSGFFRLHPGVGLETPSPAYGPAGPAANVYAAIEACGTEQPASPQDHQAEGRLAPADAASLLRSRSSSGRGLPPVAMELSGPGLLGDYGMRPIRERRCQR
jgi:hypothetical protein